MDIRQRILDAAKRVYAAHGFRGATTRLIAIEADVNEVTLFRLFGSKAALFEALMESQVATSPIPILPDNPVDPEADNRLHPLCSLDHNSEPIAYMIWPWVGIVGPPPVRSRIRVAFDRGSLCGSVGQLAGLGVDVGQRVVDLLGKDEPAASAGPRLLCWVRQGCADRLPTPEMRVMRLTCLPGS